MPDDETRTRQIERGDLGKKLRAINWGEGVNKSSAPEAPAKILLRCMGKVRRGAASQRCNGRHTKRETQLMFPTGASGQCLSARKRQPGRQAGGASPMRRPEQPFGCRPSHTLSRPCDGEGDLHAPNGPLCSRTGPVAGLLVGEYEHVGAALSGCEAPGWGNPTVCDCDGACMIALEEGVVHWTRVIGSE
ncbi:hypothetical protein BO71DRAFT_47929 [Aspergillus ellipticus CBS 707.79]|uniref:Uncharacterized protein n=1 Tax=Aspergillus ellipticus CBS 707.79 TaxID=1448320 RepID=A0A319EKJ0_9EURO|nr:hypothetical protein BO71DRAFT_47929 [Aspergillus ellipticus CBS 707.79]